MPDEPESDADVRAGADGPDDEEPRPSETDDAPDADGVDDGESAESDGSAGSGVAGPNGRDAADAGESDDGATGTDDGGDVDTADDAAPDDGDDAESADDDGPIEGTGVDDDRMAAYAATIGGGGDDDSDGDEDGGESTDGDPGDDEASPSAGSHVGDGEDPEPERLPGYESESESGSDDAEDGRGAITPVEGERDAEDEPDPDPNHEYDEDELEEEFGAEAVDPPTPVNDPAAEARPEGVTDGAGTAAGADTGTVPEDDWVEDDWDEDWADAGIVGEGPESDEEMPLADHIEEMVKRVGVVLFVGLGVSLAVFGLGETSAYVPSSIEIVEYLWSYQVPAPLENRPYVYGPLELLLTQLKVAGLTGLIVGLPVFVYETYLFMRPGLYPKERRYYLAAVPTSLVLGLLGVLFAHFIILPQLFEYFTYYTAEAGDILIAYGLQETFTLILVMMGYMAVIFQIPLFIMLAIMMGLTTRVWMEERRLLFWGAFLGLSFTFVAVDPTGMAPIVIAVTMVVLFEATLALLRWTGN